MPSLLEWYLWRDVDSGKLASPSFLAHPPSVRSLGAKEARKRTCLLLPVCRRKTSFLRTRRNTAFKIRGATRFLPRGHHHVHLPTSIFISYWGHSAHSSPMEFTSCGQERQAALKFCIKIGTVNPGRKPAAPVGGRCCAVEGPWRQQVPSLWEHP